MTIVEPLDEPKGWRRLQIMAQNETDPRRLESIIDQMNRLLDRHEKLAGNKEASASPRHSSAMALPALGN